MLKKTSSLKKKKWGPDREKIEAAKKKLGDMKTASEGRGKGGFMKLIEGKSVFRIMPVTAARSGDFYVESKKHFNVGPNEEILKCPTCIPGKKCPLCKAAKKAFAEARAMPETNKAEKAAKKAAFDEAKKLNPRTSFAMVVLQRSPEQHTDPQVLEVNQTVFQDILKYYADEEEYGPITDLEHGRDIIVVRTKTGKNPWDVKYDVSLRDADKSKPVKESVMEKLTESGPDLDRIFGEDTYPSWAKIEAAMEGVEYEEGEEEAEDDEEPEERPRKKKHREPRFTQEEEESEEDDDDEKEDESDDESDDDDGDEESDDAGGDDGDEDEDSKDADDDEEEDEEEDESSSRKKRLKEKLKAKAKK